MCVQRIDVFLRFICLNEVISFRTDYTLYGLQLPKRARYQIELQYSD
jgi:hypothetical protein